MDNEQILSSYMRSHYSDQDLAAALAHAQDGKLSVLSCCCFIGLPTANHALFTRNEYCEGVSHHIDRDSNDGEGDDAENAFIRLGFSDNDRRARLIPLIEAEINRREEERCVAQVGVAHAVTT